MKPRRIAAIAIHSFAWFAMLTWCPLVSGQNPTPPIPLADLFKDELPGEFQIRYASARAAARVYYIIYAAALDHYAAEHKATLAAHPVLSRLLNERKDQILLTFDNYEQQMGKGTKPIVDAKRELANLEAFIASGYTGELKPKLEAYVKELKK